MNTDAFPILKLSDHAIFLRVVSQSVAPQRDCRYYPDKVSIAKEMGDHYERWLFYECPELKDMLLEIEDTNDRVRLAEFYNASLNKAKQQLCESDERLRKLGETGGSRIMCVVSSSMCCLIYAAALHFPGTQKVHRDVPEFVAPQRDHCYYSNMASFVEEMGDHYERWQDFECRVLKNMLLQIEDKNDKCAPSRFQTSTENQKVLRGVPQSVAPQRDYHYYLVMASLVEEMRDHYEQWQDYECRELKDMLLEIEDTNDRVRLADFHNTSLYEVKQQLFESEEYFRKLGEIDDSDPKNLSITIILRARSFEVCGKFFCLSSDEYRRKLGAIADSYPKNMRISIRLRERSIELCGKFFCLSARCINECEEIVSH